MKGSLFRGAWMSAMFIHYEVEPTRLQAEVPFPLDLRDGKAYVSVVAFSQERLRFAYGGSMTNWVGRWFTNHGFLHVPTYVWHADEPGIFFLAEWVPKRIAIWLGPPLFGLPYRFGRIEYEHSERMMRGSVTGCGTGFSYKAERDVSRLVNVAVSTNSCWNGMWPSRSGTGCDACFE
jgi:uncharacterized protein YqjF (DUF2071 family)